MGHIKYKHLDVNESFIEEMLQNPINIVLEEDDVVILFQSNGALVKPYK